MFNFSKFLKNNEYIDISAKAARSKSFLFFTLLLILLLFFLLIPMWRAGRQGLWLWLGLLLILIFLVARELSIQDNIYIITNQRVVLFKATGGNNFIFSGYVFLDKVNKIDRVGTKGICLHLNHNKYFLFNLRQRDLIFQKIKKFLN